MALSPPVWRLKALVFGGTHERLESPEEEVSHTATRDVEEHSCGLGIIKGDTTGRRTVDRLG